MLKEERHNIIQEQIALRKKVQITALASLLKVSSDTIRRDLASLEKNGKLVRVHGGAISTDFHYPYQPREVYARNEKREIARKAVALIRDGQVIIAGGGTVMLELARIIPEKLTGTFFTVSPLVALEVAQRSSVDVILLAGRLSRNAYICTGSSVVSQLSELNADLCFMGTNGFSLTEGISDADWEIAQVKKAMIKAADKTALLCIAEKLGSVQKIQVSPLNSIDFLLTELNPCDARLNEYSDILEIR